MFIRLSKAVVSLAKKDAMMDLFYRRIVAVTNGHDSKAKEFDQQLSELAEILKIRGLRGERLALVSSLRKSYLSRGKQA